MEQEQKENRPSFLSLIGTVLSAAIGISSNKKREEDFQQGSLKVYVVIGIIAVIIFISSIMTVVNMVLPEQ